MKTIARMLALFFMMGGQAAAADAFQKVKCGADIPKALIGQRSANERVVVLEARHRALGLKHLGADETSDQLSSINWLICGSEFIVLEDRKDIIRDVLAFPAHSKATPAYSGFCQINGRDAPDIYVAVLNGEGTATHLPALSAWKIDLKNVKFVKTSTEGLRCPRDGVYTVDGGR